MEKIKPVSKARIKAENTKMRTLIKIQIFALVCYLLIFILGSIIALTADLPRKYDFIYSLLLFSAGSLSVGFFSGATLRENGLIYGVLFSLPLNIILLLISLILNEFTVGMNLGITAAVLLITSGVGGILGVNRRIRR